VENRAQFSVLEEAAGKRKLSKEEESLLANKERILALAQQKALWVTDHRAGPAQQAHGYRDEIHQPDVGEAVGINRFGDIKRSRRRA
jgi:hypothetical protein